MTSNEIKSRIQFLCEKTPSPEAHIQIIELAAQLWEQSPEDAHNAMFSYLQEELIRWYELCPVLLTEDDWAEPLLQEDPFVLEWRQIWPSLISGTEQVDRDDAEDLFDWPVPILQAPSHHSWMRLVRSVKIDAEEFGDLDFHLLGQATNLWPEHLRLEMPNPSTSIEYDAVYGFPNAHRLVSVRLDCLGYSTGQQLQTFVSNLGAPLERLEVNLSGKHGDAIVQALAINESVRRLRILSLTGSGLSDRGFLSLMQHPHVETLEELYLADNLIGDKAIAALAKCQSLDSLKKLFLHGNPITDQGATDLAQSPYLCGLDDLTLFNTQITRRGLKSLIMSPHLKHGVRKSLEGLM